MRAAVRGASDEAPRKSRGRPYLDGGWAWAVMMASFLSNTLISSFYFGYGVFLVEWMNEFQWSGAMTSFVGSATAGVISANGPIASYVILKWGCRTSHMLGGVIIAVALICCSFTSSMLQIFILYSLLAGIGGGFCYVPSLIVISEYFKKKRSIAMGFVFSGIGCGSFIFPVFYEYIIGEYGWRGAMLLSGAVNLNMVAFGLVMCPVQEAPHVNVAICQPRDRQKSFSEVPNKETTTADINKNIIRKRWSTSNTGNQRQRRRSSFQRMRAWLRIPFARRKSSVAEYELTAEDNEDVFQADNTVKEENEIFEVDDLLVEESTVSQKREGYFDQSLELLKNPSFYVLLFHNVTMFGSMMIVYGLTPLRAVTDHSMTTAQGALLVSIIGISNLFGRVAGGFIASSESVNTAAMFVSLHLATGILTLLSTFATTFGQSATYCVLVGMAFGTWAVYPVVVADQFGDRLLTVVYGYLEVANGVGCMVGPLFGGFLFDVTKTYRFSFIACGIALILGVVPLIVILLLQKMKSEQTRKSTPSNPVAQ